MQQKKPDIADLLADESFINYCKQSVPADIAYWQNYLAEHPGHHETIEAARENYMLLFHALAEADRMEQSDRLKNRINKEAPVINMDRVPENKRVNRLQRWMKIAGAACILAAGATWFLIHYKQTGNAKTVKSFATIYGERKNIQLPDGSVVNLNAGSRILIDESFNLAARNVYLEGEAFFDIKHNAEKPFIVHTAEMDVKAVGTTFDVKAYSDEKMTETSLISGLVEITLKKNNNRKLLLHPSQKITWGDGAIMSSRSSRMIAPVHTREPIEGIPEKIKVTEHGDIKEIAWKDNKLVFEDESLDEIAHMMERWYGVRIRFQDEDIRTYRFTGVFEKENLKTVLEFLKESKQFNFKMDNGENLTVYLSK